MEVLGGIAPRPANPVHSLSAANAVSPSPDRREGAQSSFAGAFGFAGLADYGTKKAAGGAGADAQGGDGALGGIAAGGGGGGGGGEAQQQLRELRQRDAEVRAHEQAHVAAGGSHVVGGPSYVYQQGPDGKQYAIGGEVSIDTSPVAGDPETTAEKARQVRRAALAPAQPSATDRQVAAEASATEAEARQEERVEEREEREADPRKNSRAEGRVAPEGAAGAIPRTVDWNVGQPADVAANNPDTDRLTATGVAVAEEKNSPLAVSLSDRLADWREGEMRQQQQAAQEFSQRDDGWLAMQRAAWAYAAMRQQGIMPTTLAPGGTGISRLV